MLKVGFVGLGIMGKPMVMNMLKAGIDVTVSDLKQELVDEVVAAGGKSAASVKELAKAKMPYLLFCRQQLSYRTYSRKKTASWPASMQVQSSSIAAPFLLSNPNNAVIWRLPKTAPSSMLLSAAAKKALLMVPWHS